MKEWNESEMYVITTLKEIHADVKLLREEVTILKTRSALISAGISTCVSLVVAAVGMITKTV